ncbi:MAG: hypothetical protein FWG77_03135 [Treponema sp.]|nr:hypothetical protein [Treponema sp.]
MRRIVILFLILSGIIFSSCTQGEFDYYDSHNILRVSEKPLFKLDGTVDIEVLSSLLTILNDPLLDPMLRMPMRNWPTGLPHNGPVFHALTAEDFSHYVVPDRIYRDRDYSGAILIKLFDTIPGRMSDHSRSLSNQWWQLVYRAADNERDVLTLWMYEPYRLSVFNGNRYDSRDPSRIDERFLRLRKDGSYYRTEISVNHNNTIRDDYGNTGGEQGDYTLEGNYSASIARANLRHDAERLLNRIDVRRFIATPSELPGEWQSSFFQTGSNFFGRFYVSGQFQQSDTTRGHFTGSDNMFDGLGAASRIWGNWDMFFIANGMDGLSVGPDKGQWRHTNIASAYNDLLWLPSDFEIRTMGHDKDNARFQTFIEYPGDPSSPLITNRIPEDRPDSAMGRSGLWRLNGYDRGYSGDVIKTNRAWLRSACTVSIGSINTVTPSGNRYEHGVINKEAMRPGIHLNIKLLRAEFGL